MNQPRSTDKKMKKDVKKSPKVVRDSLNKRRRKSKHSSYKSFIYKVLKQVHPEMGISSKAMGVMDSFIHDMFERLATEAAVLVKKNNKTTLLANDIKTAVKLLIPGELGKHAVLEGAKALHKYEESK